MIIGVGIDVCLISRMAAALERTPRLRERLFTEGERAFAAERAMPARHLAARFAAKEAALKALGVPKGLSWHELEVVTDPGGSPRLVLRGTAAQALAARGASRTHLSLSHDGDVSTAIVILEGDG